MKKINWINVCDRDICTHFSSYILWLSIDVHLNSRLICRPQSRMKLVDN